jgi:hypothetical protein
LQASVRVKREAPCWRLVYHSTSRPVIVFRDTMQSG